MLSFLGGAVGLQAEEVEVAAVRFNTVRAANGGGNWLEAMVARDTGRAEIRFYLPPELVKRDQMHGDVKLWIVELAFAGRILPATRSRFATALVSDEARPSFLARVAVESPANDGLLQPQYLTPFANEYPRTTPTYVRRENR
jgi:hypothetical protein